MYGVCAHTQSHCSVINDDDGPGGVLQRPIWFWFWSWSWSGEQPLIWIWIWIWISAWPADDHHPFGQPHPLVL